MSKAKAIKLAAALNVDLDFDKARYAYYDIVSPKGMVFASSGGHALYGECDTMREMWAGLVEDLSYGLEPCETADCELCSG